MYGTDCVGWDAYARAFFYHFGGIYVCVFFFWHFRGVLRTLVRTDMCVFVRCYECIALLELAQYFLIVWCAVVLQCKEQGGLMVRDVAWTGVASV